MKTYKFKTSINCGGCISGVTPFLEKLKDIEWEVDINHPDKILTVKSKSTTEASIVKAVKKAGFEIEKI